LRKRNIPGKKRKGQSKLLREFERKEGPEKKAKNDYT